MSLALAPSWCRQDGEPWKWQQLLDPTSEEFLQLFKKNDFQDASAIRFRKLTLALAQELINEQGLVDLHKLSSHLAEIKNYLHPLKADDHGDYLRMKHIENVLEWLQVPELRLILEKTTHGLGLPGIDHLVALSLRGLPGHHDGSSHPITDRDVRVAFLSAWMTYLRQILGSCFATAPAILILKQQPRLFLSDMQQLIHHGRLVRIFDGKEFAVPASEDPGLADLRKPISPPYTNLKPPGIFWTLVQSGLLTIKKSWQEELDLFSQQLQPWIAALYAKRGKITALGLLEMWICKHYSISLDSLAEYDHRPHLAIPSGSLQLTGQSRSTTIDQAHYDLQKVKQLYCLWTDHPLLRMWEFTLASFSDTRRDSCLWSLHTSLGINYEEKGGLAERLYQILQEKVSDYNGKTHELDPACENMHYQVQHVASRLQSAKTDHELSWLRVEYQNLKAELEQLQFERDRYRQKAQSFANLFNNLLDRYLQLIGRYFQQVYDPQMQGAEVGPYDDMPAGFRLVFKAGRSHAASWTPIQSSKQFIECIARFLVVTEQEMLEDESLAILGDDFSHIVTLLVQHVRSQEFLRSAFLRMAKGLQIPIDTSSDEALERSPVTPWVYISGGTMQALVSHYYNHSEPPYEKQSWFKDIRELWVFLIDIMRDMPDKQSSEFLKNAQLGLLMHSSTHAFIFIPGHSTFVPCWESSTYPYTWIRDHYEQEVRQIYSGCWIDHQASGLILDQLSAETGIELPKFTPRAKCRPHVWREDLFKELSNLPSSMGISFQKIKDDIDGLLLRLLPILDQTTLIRRVEEFCLQSSLIQDPQRQSLKEIWIEKITELGPQVTAEKIQESFYAAYRQITNISLSYGPHIKSSELTKEFFRFKLGLPLPIFFADCNWDHYHFAFVLNPGSDELELWRLEPDSFRGAPMSAWKEEFQETNVKKIWGCYSRPDEYALSKS